MTWGCFEVRDAAGRVTEMHVAPCSEDGALEPGHTLDITCPCISGVEHVQDGRPDIVIHERAC